MSEGLIINPGFFVYYATITVTYPSGSTLTCTCGSDSFTAETTSGSYTFVVPYAGTWTVKATKGSQSKSANVSVTTYNQAASVTLSYQLNLLSNGSIASGYTFGYSNGGFSNGELYLSNAAGAGFCSTQTIDCSQYNTCTVHMSQQAGSSQYYLVLGLATAYGTNYVGYGPGYSKWDKNLFTAYYCELNGTNLNASRPQNDTFVFDLSSLSGNYYFRASNYQRYNAFDSIIFT